MQSVSPKYSKQQISQELKENLLNEYQRQASVDQKSTVIFSTDNFEVAHQHKEETVKKLEKL